jgi:hypothetical protein
MEMKKMEILRKRSTLYILFVLLVGSGLTACNFAVEVTPTPVAPTATPIILSGSISGVVWNDECLNYGETVPAGCIEAVEEMGFIGNGVLVSAPQKD